MIKTAIKSLLSTGCRLSGVLNKQEQQMAASSTLGILCLHRILPKELKEKYFAPDLVVTPEAFQRLCKTLAQHYHVLPLTEALRQLPSHQGKPLIAITFDDGYRDNLVYAAPILEQYGLRATFYIVSELIGRQTPPWYDEMARAVQQLAIKNHYLDCNGNQATLENACSAKEVVAEAKNCSPDKRHQLLKELLHSLDTPLSFPNEDLIMSWPDLLELCDLGHEIGSHSCSHEILPLLDDENVLSEIGESKKALEEGLARKIHSFCFPNGDYDDRCLAAVRSSGYDNSVTTVNGLNTTSSEVQELKRIFIHEGRLSGLNGQLSPSIARVEISGLGDRLFRKPPQQINYQ